MRYGIIADIHGNFEALKATLEALSKEKIDKYFCLGDIVGYGANPKECIASIRELNPETVAGNHDWASVDLFNIDYFTPVARESILWTQNQLTSKDRQFLKALKLIHQEDDITLVHGTLERAGEFEYLLDLSLAGKSFSVLKTKLCFVGHTHRPLIFIQDGESYRVSPQQKLALKPKERYIINPGSVGQPRDGNPQSAYLVYDSQRHELEIKSTSYDIAKAQKKIIDAGLPRALAERLSFGK